MESETEPEPVTLLVKSPNQRHRDLELSGDRSWSVGHLKAHLSRVYPERPRPEDQRLIYSGKLLLDHQCLRDLLPKEKRHVLHLVCNVKSPSKMPEVSAKVAESTEQPAGSNRGQYPEDSSSDGLRQREVLRNLSSPEWENISRPEAAQQAFQGLGPGFSGYTPYGWLQLSWFQQIYARQYYMQYILYFYSSLSRFLMVMGATVVMYLHHVGWFPFRPRLVQNFPNDGPPPDVVNQDPNNNLQEGTDPETEDPNHLPPDRDVLDGEQTSPSFMSTAWLVFKTFFASLLPEGPPAIAN
ncbi:homocysteine-responsive endoplasmic reticulum-resident ubiquitin-like domain member 1 protein isoform X7 [Macaca mulatta]